MHFANKPISGREAGEDGNAIVEFVGVMVVIIIPALVLLTGLATTTMAQLALNDAARQSARAYVRAQSASAAYSAGGSLAHQAWANRGFTEPIRLDFSCSARPCLTPGESATARVSATITVPVIGALTLHGEQTMVVDQYRVARP
ncbi:hypothetical protein [Trueperella pyogenes]|uniref:hypothetical protein n=1 Tax=Trueperella pyogenes TaxID=1661 RepID=UPI00345CCF29